MSRKGGKTLPVINLQSQTNDTLESVRTLTILPPSPSYQLQVFWSYQLVPKNPDEFSALPNNIS